MVSSLGTSGSNGNAFSLAILTIIRRKASDTVRPIAFSTAAASFLVRSSMRARTTELAVMANPFLLGYNVAQRMENTSGIYVLNGLEKSSSVWAAIRRDGHRPVRQDAGAVAQIPAGLRGLGAPLHHRPAIPPARFPRCRPPHRPPPRSAVDHRARRDRPLMQEPAKRHDPGIG